MSGKEKMNTSMWKKKGEDKVPGLVDLVFSWSLADIMNKDLYKHKVQQIPDTFSSPRQYLRSFVGGLIAETHADLRSCIMALDSSPVHEIQDVWHGKDFNPPKNLLYRIKLERTEKEEGGEQLVHYEPECWDLIAITGVVPKRVDDLNRAKSPYTVAVVTDAMNEDTYTFSILSSRREIFENVDNVGKLFVVYLTNLVTNVRIWNALHTDEGANWRVIESVPHYNPNVEEDCMGCASGERECDSETNADELISSLGLDDSQKAAVVSCVALTRCRHQSSVKLIWGPPGTGKTKTIASLAFTLFRMRCRTLICAPTNVAVTGVTKRLMNYVNGKEKRDEHGLGDVVLFGNGMRMKIEEHEDLYDVFLQFRVFVLYHCLHKGTGWRSAVNEMINLLEDPEAQYVRYLENEEKNKDERNSNKSKHNEEDKNGAENEFPGLVRQSRSEGKKLVCKDESVKEMLKRNVWKKIIIHNIKLNRKKSKLKLKVPSWAVDMNANKGSDVDNQEVPWSFEVFFRKKLFGIQKRLILFISGMYIHLPAHCLPMEVLTDVIRAFDMLQELQTLLDNVDVIDGGLIALLKMEETGSMNIATRWCRVKLECLNALKSLQETFSVPDFTDESEIRNFSLANARLVFCTVSSSAKLQTVVMEPLELVIIDEAAQLKECESCIPLQLPGLRHAVLVGDEKQLPAMVMSKTCDEAGFGRSLFQRLVKLGHSKHLLNTQYRMHPSISLFPNEEFYDKQIQNGENVMEKNYERQFLQGKLFGTYSFINIIHGKEKFDNRHSRKNDVEVSVVTEIVSKLYKESVKSKKEIHVGCISPYKAQVSEIQKSLGNTYSSDAKDVFSVNARSVDGFQGGEEDIIIISTVRCNGNGSIGFLSNHQRTNVALTRARFCLWILGNEATLLNSNSIWQKLIRDAKDRGCFFNAHEDKDLTVAISNALVKHNQQDSLFSMDSILFKAAKWKVCFSAKFHDSMNRYQDASICNEVAALLGKLSGGWRPQHKAKIECDVELASFPLLEWCNVTKLLKLIWTVNVMKENSTDTQVIQVLDVLPQHEISKQAKEFDVLFGNYTVNQTRRCLCKHTEGGLTLPMTWPVDSEDRCSYSSSDPSGTLATQLGAIHLRDKGGSLSRRKKGKKDVVWKKSSDDGRSRCKGKGKK